MKFILGYIKIRNVNISDFYSVTNENDNVVALCKIKHTLLA